MRWAKRISIILAILILALWAGFYFFVDEAIRRGLTHQATNSLNLKTTLGSAKLSVFGQSLTLDKLEIGSPKGFKAPSMLSIGASSIAVSAGQLRGDPVHIAALTIDKPTLVIEQIGSKFNFQALAGQKSAPPSGKEVHVIIDKLTITNATVIVRPDIPGVEQVFTVTVPSLVLASIGTGEGNQNGVALKEVATQVITALAAKGIEGNDIPAQLKNAVAGKLKATVEQIGGKFQDELKKSAPGMGELIDHLPPIPGVSNDPPPDETPARRRRATTKPAP